MLDDLFAKFAAHDRNALSRLVTLVARGELLDAIESVLNAEKPLAPGTPGARGFSASVIAFTGSGGVGKSSLIGRLIDALRGQRKTVAVLACDPQSPRTGGALFGDRFRMGERHDDGVFIRSLATPSGEGAVAGNLPTIIRLFDRFGFDVIIIETVGAGQGDTTVRKLADVLVLLVQPESGDEWQWEKAGLMEVADLLVVHKADLPGADQTAAELKAAQDHSPHPLPVLLVSSKSGVGIDELASRLAATRSGTRA